MSEALYCSVLVLNRFYMAIRVINVRRGLTLLYRGCAEVITIEEGQYANYDFESWCEVSQFYALEKQSGEDYIQAVNFELQVPRIVRLTRYDKIPKSAVRFNRKNLFARDDHRCQYCGQTRPANQLSLDHVIPRAGRQNDLGKHCLQLHVLQFTQGGPNTVASRHAPAEQARQAAQQSSHGHSLE